MYSVICCKGYYLVAKDLTREQALDIASIHRDGTYDNIIMDGNGHIVGDSMGYNDYMEDVYSPDHATLTGMYDRW